MNSPKINPKKLSQIVLRQQEAVIQEGAKCPLHRMYSTRSQSHPFAEVGMRRNLFLEMSGTPSNIS
jgi:hypothetical protein